MDTIHWHMNATEGGANLHPGVNLLPGANLYSGANCAHERGLISISFTSNSSTPISSTYVFTNFVKTSF